MRIITDKVFREIGECFGCEGSTRFCFYFSWPALDLYGNLLFRRLSSMLAFHSLVKRLSGPSEKNSAMLRSTDIENGAPGPPPVIIEWVKFVRYILIVYKQKSNTKTKGVFLYTVNHLTWIRLQWFQTKPRTKYRIHRAGHTPQLWQKSDAVLRTKLPKNRYGVKQIFTLRGKVFSFILAYQRSHNTRSRCRKICREPSS